MAKVNHKVDNLPPVMRSMEKLNELYPPREEIMRLNVARAKANGVTVVYRSINA